MLLPIASWDARTETPLGGNEKEKVCYKQPLKLNTPNVTRGERSLQISLA